MNFFPWNRPSFVIRTQVDRQIDTESQAAQLIHDLDFDPDRIMKWVVANRNRFGITYVRYGGMRRIEEACRIIDRDDPADLRVANSESLHFSDAYKKEAWFLLAQAAGVIDESYYHLRYSNLVDRYSHWGDIPFPSGRRVRATGLHEIERDNRFIENGRIGFTEQ